jgi:hypothetical protein
MYTTGEKCYGKIDYNFKQIDATGNPWTTAYSQYLGDRFT